MNVFRSMQAKGPARRLVSGQITNTEIQELKQMLGGIGPAAIKPLFEALPAGALQPHAQDVLERLLTNDTLTDYLEALRSSRPSVVDAAAAALASGRGYDPGQLLALLGDPSYPRTRIETILTAQVKGIPPRTLVPLLASVAKDVRGVIARLLEHATDPGLAPELAVIAATEDAALRLHALKLLARFDHPCVTDTALRLLQDSQPPVRLEAVRCLAARRAVRAIPALCERLRDQNLKVQAAAVETLIGFEDVSAIASLLDYLKDESEYVRRAAVEVLNKVVTVDAIKDLVNALRDADWWVRVRAADALGTLGGDRVVDAVMGLLGDGDSFVRRYAVEILNTVPDARAVDPLISALGDEDWWVRERAIDALAKTADARAVMPLIEMLARDAQAVPAALRALGAIGDARATDPVCRCAASEDAEVRAAAVEALKALAKRDLPDAERTRVAAALKDVGFDGHRARPLEVRRGADPETGRTPPQPVPRAAPAPTPPPPPAPPAVVLNTEDLAPGTMLTERYRIVRHVGGGGFGTVYLADDMLVNEQVALKILSPQLCRDETMIQRFVEELRLTRRITHRNVIRIHEFFELNGARAISMEFVTGHDLGRVLAVEKRLSVARVLHLAEQALLGLEAAHELGIVHRDIKPANLLIGLDDTLKIVDFGLAAVTQSSRARLTQAGTLVGTPEFISPEQIQNGAVDGRADLYALGCVLYFALSGREPFSEESAVKTLFQHLEGHVAPLHEVAPQIPLEVSGMVSWAMARNAADRPGSAAEMADVIGRMRRAA